LDNAGADGKIILKCILENKLKKIGLNSTGSLQNPVEGDGNGAH
jgi:hypothetical protein